jgi:chemotaxis protein MotB
VRRRSRFHEPASSHERWLVSYADFITLLFAFFTVLYASSTVDKEKLQAVSDSMVSVFRTPPLDPVVNIEPRSSLLPYSRDLPQALARIKESLARDLSFEIAEGRVTLDVDQRGLVVSVQEAGSFAIGSAELPPQARTMFAKIAARLREVSNAVRVEGHTDDVPIRTARYASNWDLSTARATRVVAFLIETGGLSPRRLSAAGYSEFHPVTANVSAADRARNRRVDLVVLNPATRSAEEPGQTRSSGASGS